MVWTKKTVVAWQPGQQGIPEFTAKMDAWLTKAVADGLTDTLRSTQFVGTTFVRFWCDQVAAESWIAFTVALADEYGFIIESTKILDNDPSE